MDRERRLIPQKWFVRVGIALLILEMPAAARAAAKSPLIDSDFQNWDEVDLAAAITSRLDFSFDSLARFSAHAGEPVTYASGFETTVRLSDYLAVAPSFYVYDTLKIATNRWTRAREPMLTIAATTSHNFPCDFEDRNRISRVFVAESSFWVYRARPRANCRIGPRSLGLSLFTWDEAFLYWGSRTWTRNRIAGGIRIDLGTRFGLEVYYLKQSDEVSHPRSIRALGITLAVGIGRRQP
jgi:hypothetical protein